MSQQPQQHDGDFVDPSRIHCRVKRWKVAIENVFFSAEIMDAPLFEGTCSSIVLAEMKKVLFLMLSESFHCLAWKSESDDPQWAVNALKRVQNICSLDIALLEHAFFKGETIDTWLRTFDLELQCDAKPAERLLRTGPHKLASGPS